MLIFTNTPNTLINLSFSPMENKSFSVWLVRTFLLISLLFTPSFCTTIHQYLVPHNIERSNLGLPPFKWSKKLASYALWWARQRQQDCSLVHSNGEYGENLLWGSGHDWKPSDAVRAWAKEKCYYNHKTNSCEHNKDCLHYTQMVWKETSKIGCARILCKSGYMIYACVYDPPGNVIGQKPF